MLFEVMPLTDTWSTNSPQLKIGHNLQNGKSHFKFVHAMIFLLLLLKSPQRTLVSSKVKMHGQNVRPNKQLFLSRLMNNKIMTFVMHSKTLYDDASMVFLLRILQEMTGESRGVLNGDTDNRTKRCYVRTERGLNTTTRIGGILFASKTQVI